MSQTKQQILSILAEAGSRPRHCFGQNFMIDQNLVRLIAAAGNPRPGDLVIEVGPGTGTLTEELLASGADVLAVEIDRNLAGVLRQRFADRPNFRLIEGDALAGKHALAPALADAIGAAAGRPIKLIANLPYNIASPLIIELLRAGVGELVFTVQKEVAQRLAAGTQDDAYGPLSVMAQLLAKVDILRTLPPQAFWPAPAIESALVRLLRDDRLGAAAGAFSQWLASLFAARRKTLRKALTQLGYDPVALQRLGIDPMLRPEALVPEQLLQLFRACQ